MKIAVLDWDDTLYATTHYRSLIESNYRKQYQHGSPVEIEPDQPLSNSILAFLSVLEFMTDKIYIITNAERDWVKLCQQYLSGCDCINKIEIFSTHQMGYDLSHVSALKSKAFIDILTPHFQNTDEHVLLSFGDSHHDRTAALTIKNTFANVITKNIKFPIAPSVQQLSNIHYLAAKSVSVLLADNNHYDLEISISLVYQTKKSSSESEKVSLNSSLKGGVMSTRCSGTVGSVVETFS